MSDEQEEVSNEQEEKDEDEESGQGDEEDEEGDEDEDEEGSDEDDEDGQEEDEDEEGQDEQEDEVEEKEQKPASDYKLPEFPRRVNENPFDSILYELNSLQHSVDHLIDTFPSKKGMRYGSYMPTHSILKDPTADNRSRLDQLASQVSSMQLKQPTVVMLKDEDTQVDMQPQIIIKAATVHEEKQKPFEGNRNYAINTESNRFLTKFQEDSRRYKRWDRTDPEERTRQRFERRDYEQGIFNIDERNKEIDQAMRLLRQ